MKLEVVAGVYAETILMLNIMLLFLFLLLLLLLLLELKLSGGGGGGTIGAGTAACIFTISTDHCITIQAI
jgi:hypothetical protein